METSTRSRVRAVIAGVGAVGILIGCSVGRWAYKAVAHVVRCPLCEQRSCQDSITGGLASGRSWSEYSPESKQLFCVRLARFVDAAWRAGDTEKARQLAMQVLASTQNSTNCLFPRDYLAYTIANQGFHPQSRSLALLVPSAWEFNVIGASTGRITFEPDVTHPSTCVAKIRMDSDLDGNNYLDFRRRIRLPKAGHTYRIVLLPLHAWP